MTTTVKLKVEVTEKSTAEFDVTLTVADGRYVASIEAINLSSSGSGAKDALQGLVKLIQKKEQPPLAKIKVGR